MNIPVVAVEWVGDMSAPSALPNRIAATSPEPRPVVDPMMEHLDDLSEEEEESGTVKKTASPHKPAEARHRISIGPNLFSEDSPRRPSIPPVLETLEASNDSRPPVKPTCAQPQRRSTNRPRIATETFQSPIPLNPPSNAEVAGTSSPDHHTPKGFQTSGAPTFLKSRRRHNSSQSETSSSPSPPQSEAPNQETFTPPSTKFERDRIRTRLRSPRASMAATKALLAKARSRRRSRPPSPNTADTVDAQSNSWPTKHAIPLNNADFVPLQRRRTSVAFEMPQRQDTVEAPETPPRRDSPTIPKTHAEVDLPDLVASNNTEAVMGNPTSLPPPSVQRQPSVASPSTQLSPDAPPSLYSRIKSNILSTSPTKATDDTNPTSPVAPRRNIANRSETPPWLGSPASVYASPTSRMFRRLSRRTSRALSATPETAQRRRTNDEHSTLYSRPTSRVFRDRAGHGDDGSVDDRQARREFSFDGGMEDVVEPVGVRRERSPDDEIRMLREDHEVLRREIEVLRGEFRGLEMLVLSERGEVR
jgi:hypothetical protein